MKEIAIKDFLAEEEIAAAVALYVETSIHPQRASIFASRCAAEIIKPVIRRINKALGQDNDPRFLAYAVLYTLDQAFLRYDKTTID